MVIYKNLLNKNLLKAAHTLATKKGVRPHYNGVSIELGADNTLIYIGTDGTLFGYWWETIDEELWDKLYNETRQFGITYDTLTLALKNANGVDRLSVEWCNNKVAELVSRPATFRFAPRKIYIPGWRPLVSIMEDRADSNDPNIFNLELMAKAQKAIGLAEGLPLARAKSIPTQQRYANMNALIYTSKQQGAVIVAGLNQSAIELSEPLIVPEEL